VKNKGKNVVAKYIKDRVIDEALIDNNPQDDLSLILVVPAYKEKLSDILQLCHSLNKQTVTIQFELIIVINNAVGDEAARSINQTVLSAEAEFDQFDYPVYLIDKTDILNTKKAGVGLARKIGLDEGLRRFNSIGRNGVLVCLDADCTVAENYLHEVEHFFKSHPKLNACSIGFRHRFEEIEDKEMLQAIIQYELHLRYYIQIQDWIGLPFALQTVGSAMAVRSDAYAAQGGMPVLKAGEDFYFLHKFIGTNKCGNLAKVLVFPSGRISDRVPFGTGRAVGEIMNDPEDYLSYHPKSFEILKADLEKIHHSYPDFKNICASVSKESQAFFEKVDLETRLEECVKNTSDKSSFTKRFYRWFDAFLLMKYIHYMRDEQFENVKILEAVNLFLKMKGESLFYENEWDALQFFSTIS